MSKFSALIFSFFLISNQAHAYLTFSESGDIVEQGKYRVGFEPQILTNQGGGLNASVFVDRGYNESTSYRIGMGTGAVDFAAWGSIKYVPFPDVDRQPAMGIRGGFGIARDADTNWAHIEIAPMVSKIVEVKDWGKMNPYVAIPFHVMIHKSSNYNTSQMILGVETSHSEWTEGIFGGEFGFNLNDSYSYISAYITIPMDPSRYRKGTK